MKKPTVYFTDLRSNAQQNLFDKLDELLTRLDVGVRYRKGQLVAIKMHFGEYGNTSFIRPQFIRRIVDRIKDTGAKPFLTDTNTLYVGQRTNSVSHLECATLNGFTPATVNAPVIIADGLRGESHETVEVNGKILKEVEIAREIASADGLVVVSHFKCHELTGFGGALKNLGMGCASRSGKLTQHSGSAPVVDPEGCTGCGDCALICPTDAIDIGKVAFIDDTICNGCSHCIAICPEGTIKVLWNEQASRVQEKMAEHAKGAVTAKDNLVVYINFITQVSPKCDCYGHTDAAIVPDIGILASLDPVAIDQASVDMVNKAPALPGTVLGDDFKGDKFRGVHPDIDWTVQLDSAEALGLGKREYELEEI